MPDATSNTFTDFAGRRWTCELTAAFWLWYDRIDPARINEAGILYAAFYPEIRERGLSPEQAALVFAHPQAVRAFLTACMEWQNV